MHLTTRAIVWMCGAMLMCGLTTVAAAMFGGLDRSIAMPLCLAGEFAAVVSAVALMRAVSPRGNSADRLAWQRLSIAVLLGHGALMGVPLTVVEFETALLLSSLSVPVALLGVLAFEPGDARLRDWSALALEAVCVASGVTAAGLFLAQLTVPGLELSSVRAVLLVVGVPFAQLVVAALAAALSISSSGRSRVALGLVSSWSVAGAVGSAWLGVSTVIGSSPNPVARMIGILSLGLLVGAVGAGGVSSRVAVRSRLARFRRGTVAIVPCIAIAGSLVGNGLGILSAAVLWLAFIGVPAAIIRLLIGMSEYGATAARLADELAIALDREKELVAARRSAEEAQATQAEFLARTSHELRTPLHAILGFGELLGSSDLDPAAVEHLGQVMRSGTCLLELVEDLLNLSQIEQGGLSLACKDVRLRDVVSTAVEQVGVQAAAAGARIRVQGGDWETVSLHTDERRLRQVVSNLIGNAVKYAGGEVGVAVSVDRGEVFIHVVDSGPGIEEASFSKLFEPFERLEQEYGGSPGTGLGLPVAKGLVEALGGSLSVESIVGVGSRFTVTLPSGGASPAPAGPPSAKRLLAGVTPGV